MKINLLALICILLFGVATHRTHAQTALDSLMYSVETVDGNILMGNILNQDAEKVILRTANLGEVTILRKDIIKMSLMQGGRMKDGKFWFENPQSTRYFWSPNGYGLRKGEAYYQNVWVLFNQVAVGVTDNFSIGGGMIPLFLFAGAPTPVWITPKVSIPVVRDKVNVGVGALIGTLIGGEEDEIGSAGILYGLSTFGSKDKNGSIGLGYGFGGGEITSTPVVTFSGLLRTGARGYLLTENYLIRLDGETYSLFMVGGRRIINKAGLDFGVIIPGQSGDFIAIPWLGFTLPFGNVR